MLDTAIVGGGLSGLALASLLRAQSVDCCVYEARERLGGRVLSVEEPPVLVKDPRGLMRELPRPTLDYGPTWFWPEDNPQLSRLLGALGIATFEQHETGRLVLAPLAGVPPRRLPAQPAYASARRIVGGVGAVVDALAARIGEAHIRLGHELLTVVRREDCIELGFRSRGELVQVRARRVVLAVPPRLLHERVKFSPELSPELRAALADTPTWMASHAKALCSFPSAFWRSNGDSGAGWASYPGAVLGEVFDACDGRGRAALGGFFALGPRERQARSGELPELVRRQLAELFGPLPEGAPEPRIQDWASERFTAAALDLERPALEPSGAPPMLREPLWNERLFFAGTETGVQHPGHMEGALEAALRVAQRIVDSQPLERAETRANVPKDPATEAWLERFERSVRAQRAQASAVYQDSVRRALSAQDSEGVTQRALLEAAATAYRAALKELASAPFVRGAIEPGARAEHRDAVLAPLAGFSQELIASALKVNQTSCALRAFPAEARPDREYLYVIRSDLQSLVDEFERQVERLLGAAPPSAAGPRAAGAPTAGSSPRR